MWLSVWSQWQQHYMAGKGSLPRLHHLRLFPRPMALTALLLAPEYASSQNSGWPKCLACTLIWWVRPVSRRHCTRAALPPARGLSTL